MPRAYILLVAALLVIPRTADRQAARQSSGPSSVSGTRGSRAANGCGDGLWTHVYGPQRLLIQRDCISVTGMIVDATGPPHGPKSPDGLVHAEDGDAKGYLRVDQPFADLVDSGDAAYQNDNLVFEVVCHFVVQQESAKPACAGFDDRTTIPPVGTHVAMTGTLVRDIQPSGIGWNEIHPVSSIKILAQPE